MAIAPQYQNYNQPSYGQQYGGQQQQYGMQPYGQQQFNPISNVQSPDNGDFFDTIGQFLFGAPESYNQFQRYGPQGQDALSRLLSSGQRNMENPYEGFEGLQQETMNDFFQNILPQLTEMFGSRTNGRASSPQFQSALASGGSGLSAMLNAQKARYGQQNKQFGLQQQQLGLTPQFDIQRREMQPGLLQDITRNFFGVGQNQKKQKAGQNPGIEALMKALPLLGGV